MKEEWLMSGAMVPVDMKTTAALVAEIKRLIDVVGGMALAQPEQKPMHPQIKKMYEDYFDKCFKESSASQRTWVGLTDDEIKQIIGSWGDTPIKGYTRKLMDLIQDKLKEKNT
jgi:hypothetical protein